MRRGQLMSEFLLLCLTGLFGRQKGAASPGTCAGRGASSSDDVRRGHRHGFTRDPGGWTWL
jgi:hypothetical protein